MAKEQRGNREPKKPKKAKVRPAVAGAPFANLPNRSTPAPVGKKKS